MKKPICLVAYLVTTTIQAQQPVMLDCEGTQAFSMSEQLPSFKNENKKVSGGATSILIVIQNDQILVDNKVIKNKEQDLNDPDTNESGNISVSPIGYAGHYSQDIYLAEFRRNGTAPLFTYQRLTLNLDRTNGHFEFTDEGYFRNVPSSWVSKFNTNNLQRAFVLREVSGTCRKSEKKQLF